MPASPRCGPVWHDTAVVHIPSRLGAAFAIPLEIAAFIVLGLLAGMWADARWNASPWFLLMGITLGGVGALRAVIRVLRATGREDPTGDESGLKQTPDEPIDRSGARRARDANDGDER